MASLARGRTELKVISTRSRFARVAFDAVAVEQDELFDTRLLAETLDHLRDQGTVVSHHLMFERSSNQFAFGECAGMGRFQKALKMTDGKDVRGNGTGNHHRCRHPKREAYRHAGKSAFHDGTRIAG